MVGSSSPTFTMLLHILFCWHGAIALSQVCRWVVVHVSLTSSALPCESRDDEIFGQSYKYVRVCINMKFSGTKSMTTLNINLFRVQMSQKKVD